MRITTNAIVDCLDTNFDCHLNPGQTGYHYHVLTVTDGNSTVEILLSPEQVCRLANVLNEYAAEMADAEQVSDEEA